MSCLTRWAHPPTPAPQKQNKGSRSGVALWPPVWYVLWLLELGLDDSKTLSAQARSSACAVKRSETLELRSPTVPWVWTPSCLCRTINKAEKPTCNRIWGYWRLCVQLTGESWRSSGDLIDVGCGGFLILYVFGWQNVRNSLAEQVYPFFFSIQALFYWGMSLRNSLSGLLPKQPTVQWDSLNLKQILSKNTLCAMWKQDPALTLKWRYLDLLPKLRAKSRRTSSFQVHTIHERKKPTGSSICWVPRTCNRRYCHCLLRRILKVTEGKQRGQVHILNGRAGIYNKVSCYNTMLVYSLLSKKLTNYITKCH